ncbi:LOW QUALITY PROTEIN: claspin-like [Pogonomyrmex barbatus]|uniref:LOW QUALITY PROTEIN: claspin-like n=1 Tax=Pogonomyrmex barbatus TaxID=144034 RepID=A0A8N1S6S2_9HYME|nr:LOW QUALITY PROTEIN: claspin-like [Pogonomyrmex barbatus]
MALIVPTSAVSDLIEVSSSTKDFNTKNHDESNIFENIRKCNGEEVVTHNQKDEENNKKNVEEDERNVDENLRDVTCDITLLNRENQCYDPQKLKNNETSNISVNKFHPSDKADLNGSNEKNKLRIDYEKCDIMDNGNDTAKKVSKNILNFIDSDSEEETSLYKTLSKKSCIADDESLEHSESTEQLQITEYKNNLKNRSQRRIVDSESEEDIQTNVNSNFSQTDNNPVSTATGSYRDLIDSESEDEKQKEETENNFFNTSKEICETKDAKKKSVKKRKGSIRTSKDEAMRQIYSETQRLLRETEISLPYHRPKQRTLQEFLNRKKISTALPKAPSTAVKLKMSSVIISKVVAEKEKEAEFFYKSSDSEDDTQQSILDVSKNTKNSFTTNKTEEVSSTDINYKCSHNPKNIETNVQNSHNEKNLISDAQSNIQGNSSTNESEKSDSHVQGLPLPIFEDEISSNRKKLPTLISNSKVTLKGSPGMIIDLTDAKPNVNGVNSLLDRFFGKHLNTKKQINNKSEVTVVHLQNTQNGPLPIKEVFSYTASINTDNSELNKPGAKLLRLKENLKLQMTLKRNKEWKQKELELEAQEKEEWHEEIENDCDLSEQEESELSIESNDSEESEPEENDVCIKDKKRSKCLFADDEAEVTDNEDSSISIEEETYMNDSITESDHEENEDEKKENDEESLEANMNNGNKSNSKDNNANVHKSFDTAKNNKTNQLIEDSQDDSNITNLSYLQNDNNQLNNETDTPKINCDDNDWSESESNMPAYQQHEIATRSQICKTPLTKTSMLDMVSPITQLSVLNATLDSNKKDSSEKRKCLIDKDESVFLENTQNDEFSEPIYRNKNVLKKKLFDDIEEAIDDEYLMQLCSGKFESTQRTDLDLFSQSNTTILQLHPSKSELCSGNFNTKLVTQSENPKINKTPQDMKSVSDEDSNNSINYMRETNKVKEVESELKLRIASSDDENEEDTFLKPKKRPTKRLTLSDSEEENESLSDEENNDIDNEEVEEQYIDYDSEENEVVTIPAKDIKKVAADFLEEEAELSGSDWDSADEDEKDLDKLEFEEADDEHIDEHKVKDQLEKIHMKQILDEDKREVRLLKELLFEDGDLHTDGAGRERKFKWRNIDKLGNNIELPQVNENDGWVDMQDDEEEVKWSKLRHERDKFLEERMKSSNNEIEDELCDSQIFKLGLQAVKKIKDNKSQKQDTSLNQIDSSENMEPIMPRNITDLLNGPKNIGKKTQTIYNVIKKRSLLSRGEESLARMASLAKQNDSISHTVNTRNFVFQYIDQSLDDSSKKEDKLIEKEVDLQKKPRKRKTMSDMSSKSNKRRK